MMTWIKLCIVSLLVLLAACQQTQAPTLPTETPEVELEALNEVLILYDDSAPAGLQSALEAQSLKGIRPGSLLKPGLAENVGEGKHDNKATISNFSALNLETQAFSYTEAAQIYAIFLANLVGRYNNIPVIRRPVSSYQAGEANNFLRTFYLGTTYGNPIPQALINDARAGAKITWINYQIWNVVPYSNATNAAQSPLGFSFTNIIGAYTQAAYTTTYNRVDYRGFTYNKFLAPMEMGQIKLENPTGITVQAWAKNSAGTQIPYAIQRGNFWYISDNPFVYIHETDRYLVFADLLGPMLGRNETCSPRALARMEDLSPNDAAVDLRRMLDIIQRVNIPFGAATIPLYKNNTTGVTRTWQNNAPALVQLRRVPTIRGRIFQHGYTHQYETLNNPFGETGVDFEFWHATDNGSGGFNYIGPIPGQTPASALQRVQTGRSLLLGLGLSPVAWVTPHYAANPAFYNSFNTVYPRVMERRLYRVGTTVAGQFFPYPVRDIYGTLILPETLGSVQPGYLIDRVMAAARANRVLRCPWAGHFFHAYTIAPGFAGGVNYITPAQFEKLLNDIKALGYTYVDPTTVVQQ
jgi:uncharacterized protein YdaL